MNIIPRTYRIISLIIILSGLTTSFSPTLQPTIPPRSARLKLGFHVDQADVRHMQAVRNAGGQFAVIVLSWEDIEPEPNYLYWEMPDAALRTAEFHGIELIARLDHPPDWAISSADPTPWRLDAYTNFVRRVVNRYGQRLGGIIIWNEPNLSLEWAEQPPNPQAYAEMLKATYPVAKSIAPDLPVLMAGLAFTTDNDARAMSDLDFLEQLYQAEAAAYFDIMAAHPYGFGRPPDETPSADALNFRRLELHRHIMAAHDDATKPIWITETGWRTAAPNPDDAWQIVTPAQQESYVLQALTLTQNQPKLERVALWELNAGGDDYGYYLWHGAQERSLLYNTLVDRCLEYNPHCRTAPLQVADAAAQPESDPTPLEILAPEVTIRLGDRSTLHPHWVHLHQGGQRFSPDWHGDFFLTSHQAGRDYDLLLETMQIDQGTNRILINHKEVTSLRPRTRPDPTSSWVTQRFSLPAESLKPGHNTISLHAGQRNPARQYSFWRWENFQFRHIRLISPQATPQPLFDAAWQPHPSPSGWSETNRLRADFHGRFWLTGNRPGEIWQSRAVCQPTETQRQSLPQSVSANGACGTIANQKSPSTTMLDNQASNRPDLIFRDALATADGVLATTHRGLFWQAAGQADWAAVSGTPHQHGYVVIEHDNRYYATFETAGVWSAPQPTGPWAQAGLSEQTILDLRGTDRLYAASTDGVYRQNGDMDWQRLPDLPIDNQGDPLRRFVTRLFVGQQEELIVRVLDQLWRYHPSQETWSPFGPPQLHEANQLFSVHHCCQAGSLVGTKDAGLWQLQADHQWKRLDDGLFDKADITDFLQQDSTLYGAGMTALLQSDDGGKRWHKVDGLTAVISDLLLDPNDSTRWFASTGAGVYRTENSGQSWQAISPPWSVWDMAFDATGRLFLARQRGIAWTDDLAAPTIQWQETNGLQDVIFFSVRPHPTEANLILGGTWGNNLGVSDDGGQTMRSIHNGLETLSVLDVLWHPKPGQLTIGTIEGAFRSDDFGESWFKLGATQAQQTIHALWQTDDGIIWMGAANGLWRSHDYGATWQTVEGVPIVTVLRIGETMFDGKQWLWVGTEEAGLWLSSDAGSSWQFGGLARQSVYNVVALPSTSPQLIAATSEGLQTVTTSQ